MTVPRVKNIDYIGIHPVDQADLERTEICLPLKVLVLKACMPLTHGFLMFLVGKSIKRKKINN